MMIKQFLINALLAFRVGMLHFLQMLVSPNLRITKRENLLDAFCVIKRLVLHTLEDTYDEFTSHLLSALVAGVSFPLKE